MKHVLIILSALLATASVAGESPDLTKRLVEILPPETPEKDVATYVELLKSQTDADTAIKYLARIFRKTPDRTQYGFGGSNSIKPRLVPGNQWELAAAIIAGYDDTHPRPPEKAKPPPEQRTIWAVEELIPILREIKDWETLCYFGESRRDPKFERPLSDFLRTAEEARKAKAATNGTDH